MSRQHPPTDFILSPAPPQEQAGEQRRKQNAVRMLVLKLGFLLFFLLLALRLVQIQVLDASRYQAVARKQYEQKIVLPAARGNLYDRHGNILASTTTFLSLGADPRIVGTRLSTVARTFSRVFGKPESSYREKLRSADGGRRFVWLERGVRPEIARRIESARLDGIVILNEPKRLYHYDELAGPLLGFTDVDSRGISGLELELDAWLRGTDGSVTLQRDGLGRSRPSADYPRVEPVNGRDVVLTIDLAYQAVAEEELRRGVEMNRADGGLVIMLHPRTGEVLALAIAPSVNPNIPGSFDPGRSRNRAVTDVFEPGSLFKLVTATAAYEQGLVTASTRFNAENGEYRIRGRGTSYRVIRDTHKHRMLTFQEAIEHSSNIVMAKVSDRIGAEHLYRAARNYGFGTATGIEFPGEVSGRLKRPREWSGTTLHTLSYGYEVAVTPLQIAAAVAAVADNGLLKKPYVVGQIRDHDGTLLEEGKPRVVRRVFSEQTGRLLMEALEGVVLRGTGTEVRTDGLRIAGKTGTARRVQDGRYLAGSYTASFAGFFPVEDPQAVCLVMIDNPRSRGYYAAATAAPIFRSIARRIAHTSPRFVPSPPVPEVHRTRENVVVPDVRHLEVAIGSRILDGMGLRSEVFGRGQIILRQSPGPGKRIEPGDAVTLVLTAEPPVSSTGAVTVPDVRGLSARRALNRLVAEDFDVVFRGSGVVREQHPSPGSAVPMGSRVQVVCEPRSMTTARLY